MEDVLEVYQGEFGGDEVGVCMDETSKAQKKESRTPRSSQPGHPAIHDYEYERNGVSNPFLFFVLLLRWRHVEVTDRRT